MKIILNNNVEYLRVCILNKNFPFDYNIIRTLDRPILARQIINKIIIKEYVKIIFSSSAKIIKG